MSVSFDRPRTVRGRIPRRPLSMSLGVCAGVLLAHLHTATCHSAAAADPAKGDLPVVAPRMTRQELVRKWDLNSDGKIDMGEAELASSRMRLERAEMRLNSGVDPVTGLPRGAEQPTVPQPAKPRVDIFGNPLDADPAAVADPPPRNESTGAATAKPAPFGGLRGGQSAAARSPAAPPSAGGPSIPLTGGLRAGAQAARPGYGAAAPTDLNAGRPRGSVPYRDMQRPGTFGQSGSLGAVPRGGLVPRLGTPRPATVTPGPPRRTVEDFDVY